MIWASCVVRWLCFLNTGCSLEFEMWIWPALAWCQKYNFQTTLAVCLHNHMTNVSWLLHPPCLFSNLWCMLLHHLLQCVSPTPRFARMASNIPRTVTWFRCMLWCGSLLHDLCWLDITVTSPSHVPLSFLDVHLLNVVASVLTSMDGDPWFWDDSRLLFLAMPLIDWKSLCVSNLEFQSWMRRLNKWRQVGLRHLFSTNYGNPRVEATCWTIHLLWLALMLFGVPLEFYLRFHPRNREHSSQPMQLKLLPLTFHIMRSWPITWKLSLSNLKWLAVPYHVHGTNSTDFLKWCISNDTWWANSKPAQQLHSKQQCQKNKIVSCCGRTCLQLMDNPHIYNSQP